jgi:hypothetical protein
MLGKIYNFGDLLSLSFLNAGTEKVKFYCPKFETLEVSIAKGAFFMAIIR